MVSPPISIKADFFKVERPRFGGSKADRIRLGASKADRILLVKIKIPTRITILIKRLASKNFNRQYLHHHASNHYAQYIFLIISSSSINRYITY